jgi:beta-mannosidase
MGLDVDAPVWSTKGWPSRWQERTHLGLFNRLPYSNWFTVETLRSYLHMLEIEQLRADYNALSMYRFRCPSNNGVIYWSHNKGGPLFQFGCVDYGGRPMMPYYAVQRVFAPLAVHAYRDVSDIVVMLSNHGVARVSGTMQALHIDNTGKVLGKWQWDVAAEAGALLRVARLDGLYDRVIDRVNETFYVTVSVDGKPVSDDLLFFCPFSEYARIHRPVKQSSLETVVSGEKWRIRLDAETPVQLVELESNQKLLFSDDYFPLIPGYGKTIEVSLLEKTSNDPITLFIRPLSLDDTAKAEKVILQ